MVPPTTLAERLAARDAQRFVGRERELEFFDSLFTDDPPAQVVLVHGPGGIGKSTLLREVARRGEEKGWHSHLVEGRELAPVPGEIERALNGVDADRQPLVLFDTYERMSAAGGWLRGRLLPSLPARSLVVLAGRTAPEPEWFQGGWERLATELKLEPLPLDDAHALVRAHGLADEELARQLVAWVLNSCATFSAVSGMESIPYWAFISGLTKRQPMVVSSILALREKALSALPSTKGARLMLSTPPAIISSVSPAAIARAAMPSASRLEPHRRLTVLPGTSTGRPASSAAMRATLRLSSPAWLAQP